MRCTDDGPSKGPNHVATLLKSDSFVERNICLFNDIILMFIHVVYDKIVLVSIQKARLPALIRTYLPDEAVRD